MTRRSRRSSLAALSALSLSLAAACGSSSAAGGDQRLTVTGSSTVAPLVAEIGRRFEELHPGVRVDVQTGGSSRGITDADAGRADIGMASRALAKDEQHLFAHQIAMDGVGVIVHASNPVEGLTDAELRRLFRGEVESWSELGGPDLPITIVTKAEGRSTLELFVDYLGYPATEIAADVVIGDNQQGLKTVAGNPGAVGYVSIGAAIAEAAAGTRVKLITCGGKEPTLSSVARGDFPIVRPLNLITRDEPAGMVATFVEFACSDRVADLVEANFLVRADR